MRPRHLITILALGLLGRAIYRVWQARRAAGARRRDAEIDPFAADPSDPVQRLDGSPELQGTPLDLDAVSLADAEAAEDLAELEIDIDETADRDPAVILLTDVVEPGPVRDAGDLYGAHTPAAVDRDHPDDDRAFAEGQNWLEALETSAVENGAEPERTLDEIIDNEDVLSPPHPAIRRDTPVADHGAGGRRGL